MALWPLYYYSSATANTHKTTHGMKLLRLKLRFRYYAKIACRYVGYCFNCRNKLNYTRYGIGICPHCGLRH